MMDRPDWATDGRDWPNRAQSQFVAAGGMTWHVQQAGTGPALLMLHGTGAATHSWAGLLPILAQHFTVIAPDLPGHGFSDPAPSGSMTLPGMARQVGALLEALDVQPTIVVGHSAGAAIVIRMALDGPTRPRVVFSLNGAILPLSGVRMQLFAPLARWFSAKPLVPRIFAFHAADRRVVERLLRGTGSSLGPQQVEYYARLTRRAGHAAGALSMMAHWELERLRPELGRLAPRLVMINGGNDRTIPPAEARAVQKVLPAATLITLPGLGHLAHEEAPAQVADLILREAGP